MTVEAASQTGVKKGYDRVVVPASGGGTRSLSRKQFESLPLRERVSFLIEGTAQFFLGDQQVPAREAMGS
ncbi:MAG TPA: hypothetical protein VMK66_18565 [Myxococcales bacterium]|nr:hypothetical protein [Myxococcales bacterium]